MINQKKQLEKHLDDKVAGIGKDQELEIDEAGPGFKHDCAAKVVHEKYGKGNTIPEKHTLVKEGNKYVVINNYLVTKSNKYEKSTIYPFKYFINN
mgnify:CR=1 FL=1